ncbi:MAG: alpha/beta hydrolase [Patescibacteria group bacterium]|nr:alpha/beta hydrolase [Patescibacteria group bacterium]
MKKQIILIHGGDTYDTYQDYLTFIKGFKLDFKRTAKKRWADSLGKKLGRNFEVILPRMPNAINAKYLEWKIWFEKYIPFLDKEVVLVGHSLGGTFLVKYLSENKFPKKILGTFLVAALFDNKDADYTLGDFKLPKNLSRLEKQGGKLFFYQSQDDSVVPFKDFGKYKKALPGATFREFKNRDHFKQATFPELVRDIKNLF